VLTSTSTDANGNTFLIPVTQAPLALGEGLPSGTLTDLPGPLSSSGVIVGVQSAGSEEPRSVKRQADPAPHSGCCPVRKRWRLPHSLVTSHPGFFLRHGELTDGDRAVGRNATSSFALIVPDPDFNDITTVISFVDGILNWNSPDRGAAIFYQCGDAKVYAGFPNPPRDDCYVVTLGGIRRHCMPGCR